jgi:hypothetical protein
MSLFKSKKFQMSIVGIIVVIVGHLMPEIDEATLTKITIIIVGYLGGQGLADFKKESKTGNS